MDVAATYKWGIHLLFIAIYLWLRTFPSTISISSLIYNCHHKVLPIPKPYHPHWRYRSQLIVPFLPLIPSTWQWQPQKRLLKTTVEWVPPPLPLWSPWGISQGSYSGGKASTTNSELINPSTVLLQDSYIIPTSLTVGNFAP